MRLPKTHGVANRSLLIRLALVRAARRWRNSSGLVEERNLGTLIEVALWADGQVDLLTLGAIPAAIHAFVLVAQADSDKAERDLRHVVDVLEDECGFDTAGRWAA